MKKTKIKINDNGTLSDEEGNLLLSVKTYCNLTDITERTLFNYARQKKVKLVTEKYGVRYVAVPENSIFILTKKELEGKSNEIKEMIKDDVKVLQMLSILEKIKALKNDLKDFEKKMTDVMKELDSYV